MTITSVQTILPSRLAVNSSQRREEKPPPQTYSVPDFPFKGYQAPQLDGFAQSQANPNSAIVIDNGERA
jgi:actin-related protein 5